MKLDRTGRIEKKLAATTAPLLLAFLQAWILIMLSGSWQTLRPEPDPRTDIDAAAIDKIARELQGTDAVPRDMLVLLEEQADVSGAAMLSTKTSKGRFVHERLTEVAERTQTRLRRHLEDNGIPYRAFWIVNMLRVEMNGAQMWQVARFREVARIEVDPRYDIEELQPASPPSAPAIAAVEWNVARVGAEQVWATGVRGAGAVVGSMDTGFDWTHPALIEQYRGYDRGIVDHDHNWHDAIHNDPFGPCGSDAIEPCDGDTHGTLTMGTSVGDDGGANQIGVAPAAAWIGCRCWEPRRRTHLSYVTECFEWFVAPTGMMGENPDPALAPHVINNSWICEYGEGCTDPLALKQVVENVRAAGIVVVASAGNSGGLGCETITDPPAIYDAAFTVGSTDMGDDLSVFSSRGPVRRDGSGRLKPDIVAPGENVRSSIPGGGYTSRASGTSLAGPIVAGTVALMISAVPSLAGQVDAIEDILIASALPLQTIGSCGDVPNDALPNHLFGWGRVDAWAAVEMARAHETGIDDPYEEESSLGPASRFRLHPNRPNPFNPGTRLFYDIPRRQVVTLSIHDVAGRRVRTLVSGDDLEPGRHEVVWDGRDDDRRAVSSGVYFARLETGGRILARRRLTLVR